MPPSMVDGPWGSSVHIVALAGEVLMVLVSLIEVDRLAQVHIVDCGLRRFFRLFPGAHARVSARLWGLIIEYGVILGVGVGVGVVGSGGSGMGALRLR